jgi:hypothetical protein
MTPRRAQGAPDVMGMRERRTQGAGIAALLRPGGRDFALQQPPSRAGHSREFGDKMPQMTESN